MKFRLLALLLLASSLCFAHRAPRPGKIIPYKIEGSLKGTLSGKYAYLSIPFNFYHRSQFIEAPIINKKFSFAGKTEIPEGDCCIATLYIADKGGLSSKDMRDAIAKSKSWEYRNLVLEQEIQVAVGNTLRESLVIAGELNTINDQFRVIRLREQKQNDSIWKLYERQKQEFANDKALLSKLDAEKWKNVLLFQQENLLADLKIIQQYPFAKLSMMQYQSLVILNTYVAGMYQEPLLETWNKFPEATRTSKEGKAMYDSMMKTASRISLREGSMIPDYIFNNDNGTEVSVKSFRGQYLFIDFWTSWCGPCRAEHYNIKQAYERFKSKNFSILQVSLDDKKEKWLKALQEENLPWQNIRMVNGWDKTLEKTFSFTSVPTSYLVSPEGKIIARNLRGTALEEKLAALLEKQ
jgi:peroxiredoxin